jgi:predicted dehydrogenase
MHKRYDPDHLRIFHDLRPQLGPPIHCRGVLEEPLEVSTKTFKWVEQSDPFSYVGIHWVDLFCHYLRCTPVSLYAIGQKVRLRQEFGKDAFDATQVLVTMREGFSVFFDNNWLTPADFEGPVNQESAMLGSYGKIESDSQYRGLRYWIENKGSRTANTHFFRNVRRPDGSMACTGYGKDSLVDCLEKVYRIKTQGAAAADLAGTYPDAQSQRIPIAIIHAARAAMQRNQEHFEAGRGQPVTATFDDGAITLRDPLTGDELLHGACR